MQTPIKKRKKLINQMDPETGLSFSKEIPRLFDIPPRGENVAEVAETGENSHSEENDHPAAENDHPAMVGDKPEPVQPVEPEMSLRYNNNKVSIFDSPLLGMAEVSKVAMYGRSKYNAFNWKKQTKATEYLDCMFRHFIKVMYGLDSASDSRCKEMAHLAWNALAYLEKEAMGTLIDDRHKYPQSSIQQLESMLMLNEEQKGANEAEMKKRGK